MRDWEAQLRHGDKVYNYQNLTKNLPLKGGEGAGGDLAHEDPEPAQPKHAHATGLPHCWQAEERPEVGPVGPRRWRAHVQVAANADPPPWGDGQGPPQSCRPCQGCPLGRLPRPPTPFGTCAALCAPAPEAIPARVTSVGGAIGADAPWFVMALTPPGPQRAGEGAVPRAQRCAVPAPALPPLLNQCAQPGPARWACGLARCALVDPEQRRPAQTDEPPAEPASLEAPIRQSQHGPVRWQRRGQPTHQASPRATPRPGLVRGPHGPRPGDRPSARDDPDREHDAPIPSGGGVEGEGQWRAGPARDHPPASGDTTGGDLSGLPLGAGCVGGLAAPFLEALCDRGDLPPQQQREQRRNGQASTRPGHADTITPPGEHPCLGLTARGHRR